MTTENAVQSGQSTKKTIDVRKAFFDHIEKKAVPDAEGHIFAYYYLPELPSIWLPTELSSMREYSSLKNSTIILATDIDLKEVESVFTWLIKRYRAEYRTPTIRPGILHKDIVTFVTEGDGFTCNRLFFEDPSLGLLQIIICNDKKAGSIKDNADYIYHNFGSLLPKNSAERSYLGKASISNLVNRFKS